MHPQRSAILLTIILLVAPVLLTSCGSNEITVEGFGFERFGIAMPDMLEQFCLVTDSYILVLA